jgi:nucleoid-associated protein YgaU
MKLPFFGKKADSAASGKTIKIQPGDSLKLIAKREYGDETKWTVIYEANKWRIDDPAYLYPGGDLLIPESKK